MTAEKLQDAITLLPADLVAETDRLRTAPRTKVIQWKKWVSIAACMAVVLSAALVYASTLMPRMKNMKSESAAEAPAAMAPQAADSAVPEIAAEEAAPEAPVETGSGIRETPAAENGMKDSHTQPAGEETDKTANAPAAGALATVHLEGETITLAGEDSAAITRILEDLDYDPQEICRCMAEFTVDTLSLSGVEVNLTRGFARCSLGQAALTEKQVETLRKIMDGLL